MILKETKDGMISINERLKGNIYTDINSDKPITFTLPVYTGIPWYTQNILRNYVKRKALTSWDFPQYICHRIILQ